MCSNTASMSHPGCRVRYCSQKCRDDDRKAHETLCNALATYRTAPGILNIMNENPIEAALKAGEENVKNWRLGRALSYEKTVQLKRAFLFPADEQRQLKFQLIKLPCLVKSTNRSMVPVCRAWVECAKLVAFTWNWNIFRNRATRHALTLYTVESGYWRHPNTIIDGIIVRQGYSNLGRWGGPVIVFARAGHDLFSGTVEEVTEHDFRDVVDFLGSFQDLNSGVYDPNVDNYLPRGPELDLNLYWDDKNQQEYFQSHGTFMPTSLRNQI